MVELEGVSQDARLRRKALSDRIVDVAHFTRRAEQEYERNRQALEARKETMVSPGKYVLT
jgi:hypothetical protein